MTEPSPNPTPRDPVLLHAEITLKGAARFVREQARRTGTALVYIQDSKLKIERPSDKPGEESTMDACR